MIHPVERSRLFGGSLPLPEGWRKAATGSRLWPARFTLCRPIVHAVQPRLMSGPGPSRPLHVSLSTGMGVNTVDR